MTNAQKIKMACKFKNMSESELARRLGTSPQAFNQRLKTDKFTTDELERIADILEAEYKFAFIFQNGEEI